MPLRLQQGARGGMRGMAQHLARANIALLLAALAAVVAVMAGDDR